MIRRARGYTLIELGIVIGVISILTTAIAATAVPAFREARIVRTGKELNDLARAAANAVKRNLVVSGTSFSFNDGAATRLLSPTTPICYDLSNFPGNNPRSCPAGPVVFSYNYFAPANVAGSALATQPLTASSPLMAMVGGNKVYANGFNAWCEPFVVCVYQYRVDVFACIPADDRNAAGMVGAQISDTPTYSACVANFNVTGGPTQTAMVSVPTLGQSSAQLQFSYSSTPVRPALPGLFNNTPRP